MVPIISLLLQFPYKRPIIGVFVSSGVITKLKNRHKAFTFLYKKSTQLAKVSIEKNTTLYYFSKHDVDFEQRKVMGTYFNEKKAHWQKKEFPFPDVLYQRDGGGRRGELIIKQLEQIGIKKINPQSFDKWDVYQQLAKSKEIQPHLPLTILYKKPSDLVYMFKKTNTVYLKSRRGSRGKWVIRVIKQRNGVYNYSYSKNGKLIKNEAEDVKNLLERIHQFFNGKEFIVQQAVPLLKRNNQIIDLRAEVQRNGKGKLEVTETFVRIGKSGSPVTSFQSNPSFYRLDQFFSKNNQYLKEEIDKLRNRIEEFLINVYSQIEKSYGTFGEMGIDFALDREGNLWFIECNSRTAKGLLSKFDLEKTKVFVNTIEYAKFISNYS